MKTDSILNLARTIKEDISELNRPSAQITYEYGHQIIPLNLFENTRDFLYKVAIQINQTYEHACYDACAVMIRRMLEMLIIITYETYKIDSVIKDKAGNFMMLSGLLPLYINQKEWNLSRTSKTSLPQVKDLGDFSAHRLHYNAQRGDIDNILNKLHLRTVLEEMLYKANLKK
ncbi:hypothetical protein [Mucilaginibacter sp. R-33]|uniref:hypothetical protein n=1 Tax=Mucilaginibacter sp. R-33 TaxID=3416711 RepID=UPI003CE9118A